MATGFEQLKDALGKGLPMDSPISELLEISKKLTSAYEDQLEHSTACMLPSHIYHLPTGYEEGYYLSVDLGGSTLRIGLVHLAGRKTPVPREDAINKLESGPMSVVDMRTWIGSDIDTLKTLKGDKFFDWIALRVGEVVESRFGKNNTQVLPLGLSWSFPIESTSIDSGKVQGMGKGFVVAEDLLGTDLKTHFTNAFTRLDVKVTLEAVINDSLAALLSHTYVAPDTRCALILGTGTNAAVSLPLSMLPESKLAQSNFTRPPDAQEVLVNTEVSMFGKGIFPVTEWDDALDAAMPRPGFQPLEYLVGGHYMGEIARRIIIGTSEKGCLFTTFPPLWKDPFTLSTEVLASMEILHQKKVPKSYRDVHHTLPDVSITPQDAQALNMISYHISSRAANYCAIALHAMVKFREKGARSLSAGPQQNKVPIAYVGSVMEKFPGLLERTQGALDRLTGWSPATEDTHQRIFLQFSPESAIFGAAVAVAATYEKHSRTASASASSRTSNSASPTDNTSTTDSIPQSNPNFFLKRFKSLTKKPALAKKANKRLSLPNPASEDAPPVDTKRNFKTEPAQSNSVITLVHDFFSRYMFHKTIKR